MHTIQSVQEVLAPQEKASSSKKLKTHVLRFTAETSEIQEVENLTSTIRRESSNDSKTFYWSLNFFIWQPIYTGACV